jgi:hypothetical protein
MRHEVEEIGGVGRVSDRELVVARVVGRTEISNLASFNGRLAGECGVDKGVPSDDQRAASREEQEGYEHGATWSEREVGPSTHCAWGDGPSAGMPSINYVLKLMKHELVESELFHAAIREEGRGGVEEGEGHLSIDQHDYSCMALSDMPHRRC